MRRFTLLLCGAVLLSALPSALSAQQPEDRIGRALLAAPERLRADAAVIGFADDGSTVVLREGSNGLICWDSSDDPGRQGRFLAQCTSERNRARVEQNHRIVNAAGSREEIREAFREAEENGTREVAGFGTVYYHLIGDDWASARIHATVAVPYATAESLGMPDERRDDGVWLMNPGTSGAHLMIPGM